MLWRRRGGITASQLQEWVEKWSFPSALKVAALDTYIQFTRVISVIDNEYCHVHIHGWFWLAYVAPFKCQSTNTKKLLLLALSISNHAINELNKIKIKVSATPVIDQEPSDFWYIFTVVKHKISPTGWPRFKPWNTRYCLKQPWDHIIPVFTIIHTSVKAP